MTEAHPLDRPVWSALNSEWKGHAQRYAQALRLDPVFGPFGAAERVGDGQALAALVPADGELWTVERDRFAVPDGVFLVRENAIAQMVAPTLAEGHAPNLPILSLGDADAPEMRALAELTKPGPFAERTHRLGRFIGMRRNGQLVAMAGERMRLPDFTEITAVCTHPDHRGRGYAAALMLDAGRHILAQGALPFLHSYADNAVANALYEKLGFRLRRELTNLVLSRE
ncbi:MAG: GNAT family N-acetyltransferase [Sphingomonadaceae bacterium]